jgi:hypothetical protein
MYKTFRLAASMFIEFVSSSRKTKEYKKKVFSTFVSWQIINLRNLCFQNAFLSFIVFTISGTLNL